MPVSINLDAEEDASPPEFSARPNVVRARAKARESQRCATASLGYLPLEDRRGVR